MKVLEVIAHGGFGRVERLQLDDGSVVARKVFAPHGNLAADVDHTKLRKRFAREVKVQSEMPDTLFIPVTQAELDSDPPWFLMPLADANLETMVPALRNDVPRILAALSDILDSLEHLHSLGYVHRDLKPSNILLHGGRWKLADFGLVLPTTSKSTKLSSKLSAWGTPGYAAPEQTVEFRNVTPAADVFAFGCILHDLFGDRQRVPYQRASCPGGLGMVIEKCTETEPNRRFKSLGSLRAALFDVLATPPQVSPTAAANDEADYWVARLGDVGAMSTGDVAGLARFLRELGTPSDGVVTFTAIDDGKLVNLKEREPDAWTEIAMQYCEWAKGGFSFEYCDVIVSRLRTIYENGSVELKALAALAAAQLGSSHNRYYVMSIVLDLCGPKADDNVAQRIAIEIRASELEREFRRCADVINRSLSSYHPLIAAVIPESAPDVNLTWTERGPPFPDEFSRG